MIRSIDNAMTFNVGAKGTLGDGKWNYDATYGHSQNQLEQKWPALIAAKAQALYLGPSLGIDPDSGLDIFDAPHSRFYMPLTVAQFRSITRDSIDNDKSRADTVSATINTTELFRLPAGPVGFAAVAEYGTQYFGLKADPLSLDGSGSTDMSKFVLPPSSSAPISFAPLRAVLKKSSVTWATFAPRSTAGEAACRA